MFSKIQRFSSFYLAALLLSACGGGDNGAALQTNPSLSDTTDSSLPTPPALVAAEAVAQGTVRYAIETTFFEPDTQPNNTIFTGTFDFNPQTKAVSNLRGLLTESMTGPPMLNVPISYQLSTVPDNDRNDGKGGVLVTSFALNTTNVFAEGGFAGNSQGLYYGFKQTPRTLNPAAGGVGNAFITVYINPNDLTAPIPPAAINRLAYGDCFAGGMMGDTCMTGYAGHGTMGGYPIAQKITLIAVGFR